MASLTGKLSLPNSSKRVIDSGSLIDPGLNLVEGVGQVAAAVEGVVTSVKQKKVAKAQSARQAKADARAERSAELAEKREARAAQQFAQQQEDRQANFADEVFKDSFHRGAREVSRSLKAAKQNPALQSKADIAMDRFVRNMEQKFPDHISEFEEEAKAYGFSHFSFRATQDEKAQYDSERAATLAEREASYQFAQENGLGSPTDSYEDLVKTGRTVKNQQMKIKAISEQRALIRANRELDIKEQEHQLKLLDREAKKAAINNANILSGVATQSFIGHMKNIHTPEQYTELQKQGPSIIAMLEERRREAHQLSGYSPDSVTLIDKTFDREIKFVENLISGDISYAKQQARQLQNIKNGLGIELHETKPFMSSLSVYPSSVQEMVLNQSGWENAVPEELIKGIADELGGIETSSAAHAKSTQKQLKEIKEGKASLADYTPKEARSTIKLLKYSHGASLKSLLQDPKNEKAAEEYLLSQGEFIKAADRLSGSSDKLKDIAAASRLVFADGTQAALETVINSPNKEKSLMGKLHMKAARETAMGVLLAVQSHSADTKTPFFHQAAWRVTYNESLGQFAAVEDEEATMASLSNTGRFPGMEKQSTRRWREKLIEKGPPERIMTKLETLNRSLDFLEGTRSHDTTLSTSSNGLEYRRAFALQDFSKLEAIGPQETRSAEEILGETRNFFNPSPGGTPLYDPLNPEALQGEEKSKGILNSLTMGRSSLTSKKDTLLHTARLSPYTTRGAQVPKIVDEVAAETSLPPSLLHAIADQETGHLNESDRIAVTNSKKAKGIMQITPITAKQLDIPWEDLDDPRKNVQAGAEYFEDMLDMFDGNVSDALMGYNAGPTRIRKWIRQDRPIIQGKSWQSETFPYVQNILERLEKSLEEQQQKEGLESNE